MDVLSDVLQRVRLSGAVLFRGEFSEPWSVSSPPPNKLAPLLLPTARHIALMHIVAHGGCWAELGDGDARRLEEGDLIILPRGDAHTLGNRPGALSESVVRLLPGAGEEGLPVIRHGGGGDGTRVVCAFLHCDDAPFNPLASTLPRLLHLPASDIGTTGWLPAGIQQLVQESADPAPGGACLLSRLTELLFVEALRRHIAGLPEDHRGWLSALRDPLVGRALERFHREPAAAWTVDALALDLHSSRSVLSDRFRQFLGLSPMAYLTRWRMQLAANALRENAEAGIAAIAAEVGYGSEAAFSRAFRRITGQPPSAWRELGGRGDAQESGNE